MVYELLSNPIILIYLIALIIYLLYFLKFYIDNKQKRRSEENFIETFGNGLKSGMITSFDDVVNIYKAAFHTDIEDLSYRYNLSNLLRGYFLALVHTVGVVPLKREDMDKFVERKKLIDRFIKENDSLSPYADLPLLERNILSDISKLLDSDEKELLKKKHIELASVLKTRNQEYNKNKMVNILSVPLAVIGLILNIYQMKLF